MRISDWSSDVCSSDLCRPTNGAAPTRPSERQDPPPRALRRAGNFFAYSKRGRLGLPSLEGRGRGWVPPRHSAAARYPLRWFGRFALPTPSPPFQREGLILSHGRNAPIVEPPYPAPPAYDGVRGEAGPEAQGQNGNEW